MSCFSKIMYNNKPTKLEIFGESHKLFASLPVHRKALAAGLRVPKIYNIKKNGGKVYKYTEWVEGNTIQHEMDLNNALIDTVCVDLARYVNSLYDVDNITAVDSHFRNFVWSNNQVIYIDLKKLLCKDYNAHVLQMSKICLKSCRGDRKKVLSFLKGYSKYRNVEPIIKDCINRKWKWEGIRAGFEIRPILLEEII